MRNLALLSSAFVLVLLASFPGAAAADPRVAAQPPVVVSPPLVLGEPQEGQILRAEPGRWRRHGQAVDFVYRWERCAGERGACVPVPSANDRVYALGRDDAGHTFRVVVTASSKAGSNTGASARTAPVAAAIEGAPRNTILPLVVGTPERGERLTVQAGTWSGAEPLRLRYSWRRCNELGGSCEDLRRGGTEYVLRGSDIGHTLRVLVRADNAVGTGSVLTPPTKVVGPLPQDAPSLTAPPTIRGAPAQGKPLAATTGTWSGATPIAFSYRWLRCRSDGRACVGIPGATGQSFVPRASEVGRALRVRVTARNSAGQAAAVSSATAVVAGMRAPVNTAPPTISGSARVGASFSASTGSWRGAQPMRFSFRWHRCDSNGGACEAIGGAAAQTYAPTSGDVGHRLRVRVRAANSAGASSALSAPSAVVAAGGDAPVLRARPALSGSATQGSRLTLSTGSWAGSAPITFTYAWKRCTASLRDCSVVPGATGSTYGVSRADVAHRLVGVVTARNRVGAASAESGATAIVVGAPAIAARPTITGRSVEGELLRATPGTWAGPGPMGFGYQWTRCAASGAFATCVPILVTPSPTYVVRQADVGHRLFVQVKATNRYGASYANSPQTAVVDAAPVGALTIAATRRVVTYGARAVLTGVLVRGPGELVTVVARPSGADKARRVRAVMTSASGAWSCVTRPTVRTVYQARAGDRTSSPAVVLVRPRLRLQRVAPGRFAVRVYAARSFAGKWAIVQRWDSRRDRWVGMKRFRLRSARPGAPPTVVTAGVVQTRAKQGRVVRVILASRQTGPGYLQGLSNPVRDRGAR